MWDVGFLTVPMHGSQIRLGHGLVACDTKKLSRSMQALVLTVLCNTSANSVLPPLAKKSLTLCLDQRVSTSHLELLNLTVVDAHNATKTELMKAEVNRHVWQYND